MRHGTEAGSRRSLRAGFTAIEMVVVMAVIAILAAVIHFQVVRSTDTGRSAALAESLDALRQGIYSYRTDVRRYPTNLAYLAGQPSSATDLCGRNVPAAFLNDWRGPYVPRTITASGIQVGDATILDALETAGTTGIENTITLYIVAADVDTAVAAALEAAYDQETISAGVYGTGVLRWASDTLRFGLAVRGC